MAVFKDAKASVRFVKDVHPSRRDPASVLERLQKTMKSEHFRKEDTAWLIVDVDEWGDEALAKLLTWAHQNPRFHLAISNPKFELFLVMHFEKGNGCTTPTKVDAALKRYLPRYDKRLRPTQFSMDEVVTAVENARARRVSCKEEIPTPGVTDAYKIVEYLLN